MEAAAGERFRRLRALGDHALYALGFFGGHIERRASTAATSPAWARARTPTPPRCSARARGRAPRGEQRTPDVLAELAAKFDRFAAVLADVAEGTLACGARDERSVVKLYERWLKTGSSRLAERAGRARHRPHPRAPAG